MLRNYFILIIYVISSISCNREHKIIDSKQGSSKLSFESKQRNDLQKHRKEQVNLLTINFRYAVNKSVPAVVSILSIFDNSIQGSFADNSNSKTDKLLGSKTNNNLVLKASGVIVSSDGYIVTNNHVIYKADKIEVTLQDKRTYLAKVIGSDKATDIALLKINENNLPFIEFGNSDLIEVGDIVLTVGNPFNLNSSVTSGIVSAKRRDLEIISEPDAIESYIQTDAPINQGSSGSALVDIYGKLVGINSALSSVAGGYNGYSFAIPVEIMKKVINDLLNYGKVNRAYFGIISEEINANTVNLLGLKDPKGILVKSLDKNSAADIAGILANDVILNINNTRINSKSDLEEFLIKHNPGDIINVYLFRKNQYLNKKVTLTSKPPKLDNFLKGIEIKDLGIEIINLSQQEKNEWKLKNGIKVLRVLNGLIYIYTDINEGFIISRLNNIPINSTEDFIYQLQRCDGNIKLEGFYPDQEGLFYYEFEI